MKGTIGLTITITFVLFYHSPIHAQKIRSDEKVLQQLFAAWNSRDADKLAEVFSEDAVYEDVAAGHRTRGRAEVRTWAAGAFISIENFKIEVVSSSVHNGGGFAEWVWSGTDKALLNTGKRFSVRGVSIIEIRKGKVSSYKEYYDFAAIMRQVGVLPDENN